MTENATLPAEDMIELCTDVLITAVEGGINYWAAVVSYEHDGMPRHRHATVVDTEEPENGEQTVHLKDIDRAMRSIAKQAFDRRPGDPRLLPDHTTRNIAGAYLAKDACPDGCADIDAEVADVIFQVALFGEVIYG